MGGKQSATVVRSKLVLFLAPISLSAAVFCVVLLRLANACFLTFGFLFSFGYNLCSRAVVLRDEQGWVR